MKNTHSHQVTSSFSEWVDHTLTYDGEAFDNISFSTFYEKKDSELPDNYNSFGSAYKQFVYDSSVTGAIVFSGVYVDGSFIESNNDSGVFLDFNEGRVIAPDSIIPSGSSVSGSFAAKEFNVYVVTDRSETVLFDDTFKISQKRYKHKSQQGADLYAYYAPACFIIPDRSENVPFALGGEVDSQFKYRIVVMSDNQYDLEGCLSLFRDKSDCVVPLLANSQLPLNEYGDIKSTFSGNYDYSSYSSSPFVFINSVATSIIGDVSQGNENYNRFVGFADFELSSVRYTN